MPLIGIIVFTVAFALIYRANEHKRAELSCEGVKVEILDGYRFISEDDVKTCLEKFYGPLVGQRLDSVNLTRIEKILDVQSAVLKSQAYTTDDGWVNVEITQREPIVRFQHGGDGFYVDDRGFIFPLQDGYTSDVPVVDGEIPIFSGHGYKGEPQSKAEEEWIREIMGLISYMQKSKVWADNIVQISVLEGGDLVLVPREGKEKFIFGKATDVAAKFDRISRYYQYIRPVRDDYTSINVKFDNQIVCK